MAESGTLFSIWQSGRDESTFLDIGLRMRESRITAAPLSLSPLITLPTPCFILSAHKGTCWEMNGDLPDISCCLMPRAAIIGSVGTGYGSFGIMRSRNVSPGASIPSQNDESAKRELSSSSLNASSIIFLDLPLSCIIMCISGRSSLTSG